MPADAELVFYDGGCGLCHAFVRRTVLHDQAGQFHFAPLHGETFLRLVPPDARRGLPDSVVVRTKAGALLVKSDAALHVLAALGGGERLFARVARLVPRVIRDAVYDLVAVLRRRVFAAAPDACPVVPAALRTRFGP